MDNKLIDLHKVAGLFREIQEEEFAKTEAKEISEFKKTVEALETTEEVAEELTAAQKKLPAGLRDAIAKKQGDSTDDDEVEEKVEEEIAETPVIAVIKDTPVAEEEVAEEVVTEEPEMVSMDTNTLAQILSLAGLTPVTDADINQPEADAQPVEEYSNSPDEEYADTDTQLNKMSGGINRPKAMPTVGNDGHNRLVMKLKKAYTDIE
jgi:hypothetical protein